MGIKKYKPITPSRRQMTVMTFERTGKTAYGPTKKNRRQKCPR